MSLSVFHHLMTISSDYFSKKQIQTKRIIYEDDEIDTETIVSGRIKKYNRTVAE